LIRVLVLLWTDRDVDREGCRLYTNTIDQGIGSLVDMVSPIL